MLNVNQTTSEEVKDHLSAASSCSRNAESIKWSMNKNFNTYEGWLDEKRCIVNLDMSKLYSLKILARYLTVTLDKIASCILDDTKIPEFLFDIRYLIVMKVPQAKEKFAYVLRYVENLKKTKLFDITIKSGEGISKTDKELEKLKK